MNRSHLLPQSNQFLNQFQNNSSPIQSVNQSLDGIEIQYQSEHLTQRVLQNKDLERVNLALKRCREENSNLNIEFGKAEEKKNQLEFQCNLLQRQRQQVDQQVNSQIQVNNFLRAEFEALLNLLDESKRSEMKQKVEKIMNEQQHSIDKFNQDFQPQLQNKKLEIQRLQSQSQEQENRLQIYKYSEADFVNVNNRIKEEHEKFLGERDYVLLQKKEIQRKDKELENIKNLVFQKSDEIQEKQMRCEELKYQNNKLESELQTKQNVIDSLEKKIILVQEEVLRNPNKKDAKSQKELDKKFEQLDNQLRQKNEQILKQMEIEADTHQKDKQEMKKKADEHQMKILKAAQEKLEEAKQAHGQLDVCFLVDVTGSMEAYKEQTKKCIQLALQAIKKGTNRDTHWASICYQDFAEHQNLGKYHQFEFSQNSTQLEQWFDTISCSGGGDCAEDIRGAIEQMYKLNWEHRYKIAILICDAPCHGKKYNGGCVDDHKKDDIRDAIEKMIQQEIFFVGFNFTKMTIKMYEEIKKIYIEKKREDLLLFADLQNMELEKAAAEMSKWIGEASKNTTQVNNPSTKTKNQNINFQFQSKDCAMEALCKQKNHQNFENFVKTIKVSFNVNRIEIKEASFKNNIKEIQKITAPQDYKIDHVAKWECIRTETPYAYGMMKEVFLMKKQNSNELYVIKTPLGGKPYRTKNDAILDCRSHLVAQRLMKKFYNDLDLAKSEMASPITYPKVIYSDFLILEESSTKYWIAERFFEGSFVKYSSNFGYICEDLVDLNKIAQSFSYYTYIKSDCNYIVCDVQGVGGYFTDPAINTKDGLLDDTDMGKDGQQLYLVSYDKQKEQLAKQILQLLGIYQ